MRDHDDMRFYYETATFLLMLSAFVSAVVFTLTKYAVQSDVLIIGLATLLVAQTLLFPLIRSEQRLKRFKLQSTYVFEKSP
jgi:membrane protein YqaA with SNARE-associated domain